MYDGAGQAAGHWRAAISLTLGAFLCVRESPTKRVSGHPIAEHPRRPTAAITSHNNDHAWKSQNR